MLDPSFLFSKCSFVSFAISELPCIGSICNCAKCTVPLNYTMLKLVLYKMFEIGLLSVQVSITNNMPVRIGCLAENRPSSED
jgi:hypothetical protein